MGIADILFVFSYELEKNRLDFEYRSQEREKNIERLLRILAENR